MADKAKVFPAVLGDPEYERLARRCLQGHYSWDKVRVVCRDPVRVGVRAQLDPELLWVLIKLGRMGQYRSLGLKGPDGQEVKYLITDSIQRELSEIDRNLGGSVLSVDDHPLDNQQRERYILNSFREEAIASSMLEGAATTRRVAKEMLRSGRSPRNLGERMVLNNYRAIQFIRERTSEPLSREFLLELQAVLTADTLDDPGECGRFRTVSDDIIVKDQYEQIVHTPPRADELEERIARLCDFANNPAKPGEFVHPIVVASTLHFQLGVDHPFCDGNGRTARAIFYWCMLRLGYWLFEYLPISRLIYKGPSQYGRAFLYSESDDYDMTYFLQYSARILGRAREDLRGYLGQKQRELAVARRVFAEDGDLNHRQRETVLAALRNPDRVTTIAAYQGEFNVSYGTANTDLDRLVGAGYLRRSRSGNRYDFARGPRLDAIEKGLI